MGIWSNKHSEAYLPITNFIKSQGAIPAIQLAHAGRKASANPSQYGGGILTSNNGGWQPVGPSEIPYDKKSLTPKKLSTENISQLVKAWATAAQRSLDGGFQIIELHFAHGYLNHEFLSEKSNTRNDQYGGSLENRARFSLEIIKAVRGIWPDDLPLLVRISADEYVEGGFDINQSIKLCKWMKDEGVDMADVSSGGNSYDQKIELKAGYQVPFASTIKRETGILTSAVGLITEPHQAEQILKNGHADAVFLGRELLRNPYWTLDAASKLGINVDYWPVQYQSVSPGKV